MTAPLIPTPALAAQIRAKKIPDSWSCAHEINMAYEQAARLADAATPAPATITRHDWFAGQALAGICAGYWGNDSMGGLSPADLSEEAYQYADRMMALRK